MRNFAISSALVCCFSGLFLITSWALAPGLGDSLIQPFAGLLLMASVIQVLFMCTISTTIHLDISEHQVTWQDYVLTQIMLQILGSVQQD